MASRSLARWEPRYAPGFRHFDYVNPEAPVGGLARLADAGTFDSLNFVIPRGRTRLGLELIYDSLMTPSLDEISSEYGLLAEAVSVAPDLTSVTYRLRAQARWHDGRPVTPEDVVFSFSVLKEHNPQRAFYYRHVVAAEKTGERAVTFRFEEPGNRELPQIVGQLLVGRTARAPPGSSSRRRPQELVQRCTGRKRSPELSTPSGFVSVRAHSVGPPMPERMR